MDVNGHLRSPAALPLGKVLRKRMGEPRSGLKLVAKRILYSAENRTPAAWPTGSY
jgi:hypothetical protein